MLAAGAGVALFVTLAGMIAGATSAATNAPAWVLAAIVIALALAFLIFGQLLPRAIARRRKSSAAPSVSTMPAAAISNSSNRASRAACVSKG